MKERVKIFTYAIGAGATVIETKLEDQVNEWLAQTPGRIVAVNQSESERQGAAHVTLSVWYLPDGDSSED